ncbi:F-box DNA helicase 1-like [Procambarus clarkii]|uniref:F-box DNA helicase 1-like n=1 Tax=Procambarus clarkii TaxID=6728 RepID=UPI003742280C
MLTPHYPKLSYVMLAAHYPTLSYVILAAHYPKLSYVMLAAYYPTLLYLMLPAHYPTLSYVMLAAQCPTLSYVFVGDSCQQLRFFGGTVSALDKVTATHKFSLSQSFRFGPEVSYVAQCALEARLLVPHRTVVGARKKDSFVHAPDPKLFDPSSKLKRAYIAMTNTELYRIATKICEDKEYIAASMTFAGGLSKYGYDDVMDIFNLNQIQEGLATRESANIQNPLVAKFETIADLTNFAKTCEDRELLSKINMFHYSGSRTPYHVTLLTQRCNTEASEADICFSTVHMAKGLEWDWVILTDGIINPLFNLHDLYAYNDEMLRQAYVSSTRAKKFLTINNAVLYALLSAHDELDVLVARKSVQESVVCLWCHAPVTPSPSPLIIKALSYYISDKGYRFPGGYMCDGCATNAVVTSLTRITGIEGGEMQIFARASRLRLITGKQHESTLYNENAMRWMDVITNMEVVVRDLMTLVGALKTELDSLREEVLQLKRQQEETKETSSKKISSWKVVKFRGRRRL